MQRQDPVPATLTPPLCTTTNCISSEAMTVTIATTFTASILTPTNGLKFGETDFGLSLAIAHQQQCLAKRCTYLAVMMVQDN
jgi:hypothetical protein